MSESETALELMRAAIELGGVPHGMWKHMGLRLVAAAEGTASVRLELGPHLGNINGIVHGGAYATLLDSTLGSTVHTVLPFGAALATVDLTISYLRATRFDGAALLGVGTVTRKGRRICHATGEVFDDAGRLVATATGSFLITTADSAN